MLEDAMIVEQVHNGNLEQFGILYDRYIEKIYRHIYFKTHHRETAEDLTSQSFFKAFDHINSFNSSQGTFSSWIYKIANNLVIDHYRTKKDVSDIDDIWDISTKEDIERDIDIQMKLEQIEEYIKKLQKEQREILIMRLWQDLSFKEIAEILGKSEASCKMSYKRSLDTLKENMSPELFTLLFTIFLSQ